MKCKILLRVRERGKVGWKKELDQASDTINGGKYEKSVGGACVCE